MKKKDCIKLQIVIQYGFASIKLKQLKKTIETMSKSPSIMGRPIIAMDCEMVGAGPKGEDNMLAKITIIDFYGHIILDTYVSPDKPVTDYRTRCSGVKESDLINAPEFSVVQEKVRKIIENSILVGHSLRDDFVVLKLSHDQRFTRDTAEWNFLAKTYTDGFRPSLKKLARVIFGKQIQFGEHSALIDATTTLDLYKHFQRRWEREY